MEAKSYNYLDLLHFYSFDIINSYLTMSDKLKLEKISKNYKCFFGKKNQILRQSVFSISFSNKCILKDENSLIIDAFEIKNNIYLYELKNILKSSGKNVKTFGFCVSSVNKNYNFNRVLKYVCKYCNKIETFVFHIKNNFHMEIKKKSILTAIVLKFLNSQKNIHTIQFKNFYLTNDFLNNQVITKSLQNFFSYSTNIEKARVLKNYEKKLEKFKINFYITTV